MAGNTAILAVRIIGDASGATKAYKTAESAGDDFAKHAGKLKDVTMLAGVAAGAALTKGLTDAISADTANRKLAGQLGLGAADAEAAGELSGKLYSEAYGDSVEQVNEAIGAVASTLTTMSSNGGADVERLSQKALDLAGTFGTDVTEAVGTAGILMKTGLAADGDEAFDLLVGSMQKMPKAMQAELLPVMDEYSTHFANLGIDGTTAFGIMAAAAENGAIGMDKTGDALKELTIRATDGSEATAGALEQIGLMPAEIATAIASGGDQASDAFGQIVTGLQGIEDPAARAQAAVALFGTPIEDLGIDQIPTFLAAVDPANAGFESMAGSAQALSDTVNNGPGVALTEFARTAELSLQEVAAAALPVLQPMLDTLMQYAPVLGPAAVAVAGLAAAVWIINGAITAYRTIVAVATGLQWAWNAAMAANPIGIIILLIAALVAGVILAYQNVGWFKDAVDTAGRIAGDVFNGMIGWIEDLIGWLDDTLAPVGGIQGALEVMGTAGQIALDAIIGGLQNVIGWVQSAIGWFNDLFGAKSQAESGTSTGLTEGMGGAAIAPAGFMTMSTYSEPTTMEAAAVAPYSTASTSTALSDSIAGLSARAPAAGDTYVNVEIKADATTDTAKLGRALTDVLRKYARSTGRTAPA